jgi:glycosyltransferase involved in cell wall biosynthesis
MPEEKPTSKITLLHLIQNLGVGGAEILLLQYIKALGTEDYNHLVYSIAAHGPMQQKLASMDIPLAIGPARHSIRHPFRFGLDIVTLVRDLRRFIGQNRIQIIQSHLPEANQLGVLVGKLSGVPIFTTIHNTNAFEYRQNKQKRVKPLHQLADRCIYRAADRVIAISEEVKHITQQALGIDPLNIVVVKNGIVPTDVEPAPVDLKKELNAADGDLLLIAVGSLTFQKAFEVLIEAAAELVSGNFNGFRVAIIGKGREHQKLQALIGKHGLEQNVKLLGYRGNVMDYLRSSDVFVMPSRYEGLSIAMIEAMACGLPIVASNAPGLRTCIDDQHNGLLFELMNHKDLAEKIKHLAEEKDLRNLLARNARHKFEQTFNMNENILPLKRLIAMQAG